MLRITPLLTLALLLVACDKNPDTRTTTAESNVTAKAVADTEAAMAEARRSKALPPPVQAPAEEPAN